MGVFEARSQTFIRLDKSVYTSADTSLTGVKCISVHVALQTVNLELLEL